MGVINMSSQQVSQLVPKYKIRVLNSANRDRSSFPIPNNFPLVLSSQVNGVLDAALIQANIPITRYTVDTHNNLFKVTIAGTTYDISLTKGIYISSEIEDLLQNTLNAHPAIGTAGTFKNITWTVTEGNNDRKFTIENDDLVNAFTLSFSLLSDKNQAYRLMGYAKLTDYTSTIGATNALVPPFIYDLSNTRNFFIQMKAGNTDYGNTERDNGGTYLAAVPIANDAEVGAVLGYENPDNKCYFQVPQTQNVKAVTLRIEDDDGELYEFNGIDWSITVRFVHY
jgi:hypothetical protein